MRNRGKAQRARMIEHFQHGELAHREIGFRQAGIGCRTDGVRGAHQLHECIERLCCALVALEMTHGTLILKYLCWIQNFSMTSAGERPLARKARKLNES